MPLIFERVDFEKNQSMKKQAVPRKPPVRKMVARTITAGQIDPIEKSVPFVDVDSSLVKNEHEFTVPSTLAKDISSSPRLNSFVSANLSNNNDEAADVPGSRKRKRTPREKTVETVKRKIGTLFECMENVLDQEKQTYGDVEFINHISEIVSSAHRGVDDFIKNLEE